MGKEGRKIATMVKLDPTTRAKVEHTAEREGISVSAVVRRAIKHDKAIRKGTTQESA